MNWNTHWVFRTANFTVKYETGPDHGLDLSFDDTGEISDKLVSGELMVFTARVAVYYDGTCVGEDYLGGCIYESPEAFMSHNGADPMDRNCSTMRAAYGDNRVICHYFPDMVTRAIADARRTLCEMQNVSLRAVA